MSEPTEAQPAPRHFDQVPEWPALGGHVSGRVSVTKIASWRTLAELLDAPFFSPPKTQIICDGHRREEGRG